MIIRAALEVAVERGLVDATSPTAREPDDAHLPAPPHEPGTPKNCAHSSRRRARTGSTQLSTSRPTPACDAARSSGSSGPISTAPHRGSQSPERCRTSAGALSSSASRHVRADAPSTSDTTRCATSNGGAAASAAKASRRVPSTGCSATPGDGSSTLNRSATSSIASCAAPGCRASGSTICHTHASLLIAAGVPIKVVSERLGHAHPAFTMHTYQHLLPGMSAAAAERFAALVAP